MNGRIAWLLAALALPGTAQAQTHAPARASGPVPRAAAMVAAQDAAQRMTIPVTINGSGPFAFVVDTGADRTVISRELAASLGAPPGRRVMLHHTGGTDAVDTVVLDSLSFGGRTLHGLQAPALAEADVGAAGMLGIDSLADQQVTMNFDAGRFSATPSIHDAPEPPGTIVVYGRPRFGQLVLVDAHADGERIFVILDSGAQNTLGNTALRELVSGTHRQRGPVGDVVSVAGAHSAAWLRQIDEVSLGGITMQHVPVAYADLETFRQFGLQGRPAMLLGMDVLRLFRSVSVDFPRRLAAFVPR